jgi:hypothetical protein
MLELLAALFIASAADAGAPAQRADVRSLFNEFVRAQDEASKEQRLAQIAALKTAAASASGDERKLIDRMTRLLEKDEPLEKVVPEFADIVRATAKLARGRFDDERVAAGAYLSLPATARNAGLDPEPLRREAMAFIRDLVARYPNEGSAHGLLASALMEAKADSKLVLVELKRCSELDGKSSCTEQYSRLLAEFERPRCRGTALKKLLTARGAHDDAANGQKYSVEANPFLRAEDFASVSVDEEGNLALEVTTSARARLAQETRRLLGKTVVLMLGDEVLLAARVQEPISDGRVRVTQGQGKPPFKLEELCRTVEHPAAP